MAFVKLAEVKRGQLVESEHWGAFVVLDQEGKRIAGAGEPTCFTYWRSAAKPLQALAVVESGATAAFNFNLKEIALLTGSHQGEAEHLATVSAILAKIGLGVEHLFCGLPGDERGRLACPCSGKQAGMLALARYRGFSLEDYLEKEHPVQEEMKQIIAEIAEIDEAQIVVGIDGCGAPVFALTLEKMAYAYARLMGGQFLTEKRRQASLLIQRAMWAYPQMVEGSSGFDTALLRILKGKVIPKFGAAGIYCLGLPAQGWGLALKIADGQKRALAPVVLTLLAQLGLLTTAEKIKLQDYYLPKLKNIRGEIIGEIRAVISV